MQDVRLVAKKGRDGQWYPQVFAANNEQVFGGEAHENKSDVISLLQTYFPGIAVVEDTTESS